MFRVAVTAKTLLNKATPIARLSSNRMIVDMSRRYLSQQPTVSNTTPDANTTPAYLNYTQKMTDNGPTPKFDNVKQEAQKQHKSNMYFVMAIIIGSFIGTISLVASVPSAKELNMCALLFNLMRSNPTLIEHVGTDSKLDYEDTKAAVDFYKMEFLDMATFGNAQADFTITTNQLQDVPVDGKLSFQVDSNDKTSSGRVEVYYIKHRERGKVRRSLMQLYEYSKLNLMENYKTLDGKVLKDLEKNYNDFVLMATFTPLVKDGKKLDQNIKPVVVYNNKALIKKTKNLH